MTNYYNANEAKGRLDLLGNLFRGIVCPPVQNDGVLFVRMCKSLGYCLSACANLWGTVCPRVQIDGVLFVRVCKNDGVLIVRGTICP